MATSRPTDTSEDVDRLMVERWRSMSALEKVERVMALGEAADAFARAGLRARHPGCDEERIDRLLARLRLGPELSALLDADEARRTG